MTKDSTTAVSLGLTGDTTTMDPGPTSHAQWGAIAAGSLAGFGATIVMTTLGMAIGATTGAFAAEDAATADPGKVAVGVGAGLAVWTLLSAIVVGFVGGAVLNRMARYDRPYMPMAFGALSWAGGVTIALLVGAASIPGLMGGAAGAAAAGIEKTRPDLDRAIPRANGHEADPREAAAGGQERRTPEKVQEAAEKAATGAAAAAWVVLGAQLVSLAATMLAARWRKARAIPVKAGPRIE